MIEEIWKVYADKRNNPRGCLWEISNLGRVKKNGELYQPGIINSGYYSIGQELVHRLVAELFIPNPENKPCIDHIDDNKLNNEASNLRWVTYSENNGKLSHIEKQSKTLKERELSPEWKEHVANGVRKAWEEKEHHSDETKALMSDIRKEWWKTHTPTKEHLQKISDANKGKIITEKQREKIRKAAENNPNFGMRGKHHSEETKAILRAKKLGVSSSNKGIPKTDEQKRKQSKIMTGRKRVYHDDGTWHMTK